ncbi:tRNA pseudouridine(55) synthase TruB [Azovibrio restrictus]|uniref:tRNA pseudouridine(55) synthase TruB n=1 Tax=Azovibrio restrictus TaxID=146938 RepID=UPI0026EAA800|nr:tRNA pseudouridine(55) synthase TruB [Azovibrio restrictus]MDD3484470.1 tRNA pseudouridine(55) synthase TruB [Azovibrio restrictus]
MQQKRTWKQVNGVLLLDKPQGMSSNDALQKARRLFSAAKGGHTGTLDPMATGLLPLCFGEATKFSADLLDADKTYEAQVLLGSTTDTGDREGQVTGSWPVICSEAEVRALLPRFTGEIQQIPPMYSALKRDGRPLYELARKGQEVERQPRAVTIHSLELLSCPLPGFTLRVTCSKGTYIRVLAEDMGRALGCGAHLTGLRRTRVGPLNLEGAATLAELESKKEEERAAFLKPVDSLLASLPAVELQAVEMERFSHGNPVAAPAEMGESARVYGAGRLLGLGQLKADGLLWPKRLIANAA